LRAAASSTIPCATERPPRSADCTVAPSAFDVLASTNTPRPAASAVSRAGASDPKPRKGESVTASAANGAPGAR
jgi:hypothetical protein